LYRIPPLWPERNAFALVDLGVEFNNRSLLDTDPSKGRATCLESPQTPVFAVFCAISESSCRDCFEPDIPAQAVWKGTIHRRGRGCQAGLRNAGVWNGTCSACIRATIL
jgi:hypothetical protein